MDVESKDKNTAVPLYYRYSSRGYKEMSSILADQKRPRVWAHIAGEGGELRGLS